MPRRDNGYHVYDVEVRREQAEVFAESVARIGVVATADAFRVSRATVNNRLREFGHVVEDPCRKQAPRTIMAKWH